MKQSADMSTAQRMPKLDQSQFQAGQPTMNQDTSKWG